ncbi:MAG: LysR substrate-binding domain-containing protein [Pseudomonadota bacterium]
MDTDALRLFVLAAEKLNISAAGRDLGLAPSVASAWMAKLETSVGADLLHRSTRKVSLSTEGAEFLPYARDIIAGEDAARAALGQRKASVSGLLRFTAPSTFAQLYIVPILPEFMADHPDLTLDLHLSDRQLGLIEGSFDLALRNAPLPDSSLRARKLARDTRVLCAAPSYLRQHGAPTAPRDLEHHGIIAFGSPRAQRLISDTGDEAAFAPEAARCRLIIDDGLSHKLATLAGAGISANSLWSVQAELRSGALIRVLPTWTLAEETMLWLIYPHSNVLSVKVRLFMDFLLHRIGQSPPWVHRASDQTRLAP